MYELNLFDIAGRKQIEPNVGRLELDWESPRLRWKQDQRHFTYEKIDRGHQRLRVIEVDFHTGQTRNLIDQQTETFLWTAHTENLGLQLVTWLDKSDDLIYASGRDGWRHLYFVDGVKGEIHNQITKGEWLVRGIDRIDEDAKQIWFYACGKNAGPQSAYVPKSFSPFSRFSSLTDLGFVVVQIDGMGTAFRSKAFHDVCWHNLKDAGLPDRILWHQAAAAKYPWYDITRVGVYGSSAGGQNAAGALLFHPEFYKVAVASCGCHDNRMDKASWNKQWMGYPIGAQYAKCSNIDNAARLKGKLLLIVSEMDDNVPPESTMRFVDALIKAGKNFDLLVVPGAGHGMGGAYGQRRMQDFFVRHLLGVEPPDRNTN